MSFQSQSVLRLSSNLAHCMISFIANRALEDGADDLKVRQSTFGRRTNFPERSAAANEHPDVNVKRMQAPHQRTDGRSADLADDLRHLIDIFFILRFDEDHVGLIVFPSM